MKKVIYEPEEDKINYFGAKLAYIVQFYFHKGKITI